MDLVANYEANIMFAQKGIWELNGLLGYFLSHPQILLFHILAQTYVVELLSESVLSYSF